MTKHKCLRCGEPYKITIEDYHYLESGLDNLWLCDVEVYRCQCGESAAIPQPIEIHRAIARCLLMSKTPLSGKEIRFLRKHIAMKAIEFAKRIGVDNATISRWENGKENPSDVADRVIRLACAARLGYSQEAKQLFEDIFPEIGHDNPIIPMFIAADQLGRFSCTRECR
jgi:putative zinc finger/helix-turn-helix YgiT family protein